MNLRKKSSRHRGSWTHGHGEKKKRRGAGSRGGRGNAGSGKRGDAKKPSFWKIKDYHKGKKGFSNPAANKVTTITLTQLNSKITQMVETGIATKKGKSFIVNCQAIGINKLLGTGVPSYAFEIVVASATKGAIAKVEEAGGKVELIIQSESGDSQKESED
jgi:large subunit ribosomal protein L15